MIIQDMGNASDVCNYDSFGAAQGLNANMMLLWHAEMARRFIQEFIAFAFHRTKILFQSIVTYSFQYCAKEMIIGSCSVTTYTVLMFVAVWSWRTNIREFCCRRAYQVLARIKFTWKRSDELCGGVGIVAFRKRLRIEEAFLLGLSGRRLASSFTSRECIERWDDMSLDAGLTDR
jgi:hypothetical protein